jgi:hypothetical protein
MIERQTTSLARKRELHSGLSRLAEAPPGAIGAAIRDLFAADVEWRASHPLNQLNGIEAVEQNIWRPLKHAMPDLERRDVIFVGGVYEGRSYVAALGQYCGTFRHDWLTIPATGRPVWLRYGEVYELRDGAIVQANCLWDILDLIRQAGFWPLAPSRGVEGLWPGPITGDGLVFDASDPAESVASLAQTLAMHATLGAYNDSEGSGRDGLIAMPQREYWHPRMMWYGPSGIGTTRGLQ